MGQAHMLLAQQAPPGTGRAGRQLQGLRSKWLLLPVLRACQVHPNHMDLWPPLQMHPAGGGFHLTVAGKRTFSHTEGPFAWQTLFLDPWSPNIPLTSLEVITSPLLVIWGLNEEESLLTGPQHLTTLNMSVINTLV